MARADIVIKCVALGLVLMVIGVQANGIPRVIPNHPNCPDREGPIPVYFVHPTNCSKFYECHRKDAHELDCPAGLHFNSRLNVCDYPLAAQCESLGPATTETPPPMTSTEVPTGPTQTPTSTPTTQEWTSTDTSMTTAYTSAPQHTTTIPPPTTTTLPTTYSTTTLETTVFPTTANPTTSSTPSPWETPTTQAPVNPPTNPHCPPAGASWPNYWSHPSDCTKYLACWEGCIQQFKCPDGRYWNDGLKACDQNNRQCTCPVIPPAPNVFSTTTPV